MATEAINALTYSVVLLQAVDDFFEFKGVLDVGYRRVWVQQAMSCRPGGRTDASEGGSIDDPSEDRTTWTAESRTKPVPCTGDEDVLLDVLTIHLRQELAQKTVTCATSIARGGTAHLRDRIRLVEGRCRRGRALSRTLSPKPALVGAGALVVADAPPSGNLKLFPKDRDCRFS